MNNNVKQEQPDFGEIEELAQEIVEGIRKKLAAQAQRQQQQNVNGHGILKFNQLNMAASVSITEVSNAAALDVESIKGRFGWVQIAKVHIPYLIRGTEYYCSVRMVEMNLLSRYLNYLHSDIYNCTCIPSYYITEAESKLLNEINVKHCDYQFGRDVYSTRDLIVRLEDAMEFYKFLLACYNKLSPGGQTNLDRCGFVRINNESVVPYAVCKNEKYVPLFYFEGETGSLSQKADKLEGWDLAYLKFCFKVQGIRNELFSNDSCDVINLNDIKKYFPPGTVFEDYWPMGKCLESELLSSRHARIPQQSFQWTRQPSTPPAQQAAVNNNRHMVDSYFNYGMTTGTQPSYPQRVNPPQGLFPPPAGNNVLRQPGAQQYSSYYNMNPVQNSMVRAPQVQSFHS